MPKQFARATIWSLAVLLLVQGVTGCASSPARPDARRAGDRALKLTSRARGAACLRPQLGQDSPYRLPLAGPVLDPQLTPFLADVPAELRRTLLAAGLEPLLAELRREQARSDTLTLPLLAMKQELNVRLNALESQLASVLYEIDCSGDALEALLLEFGRREHERELKLTISSLVAGAIAGVVAGAWEARDGESKGPAIVAAAGAGASAALGIAAFAPHRGRSVLLNHEQNLLAPIRAGVDESHLYPTFVFRLLTLPYESGRPTPQRELLARWEAMMVRGAAADVRAARESVLYGRGGRYDEALLKLRETMFDELEQRVSALYRELELLERYLANVAGAHAPG